MAEDELNDHIGLIQPKIALEELSSGIQKIENNLSDREIESFKVGAHKSNIVEINLGKLLAHSQSWLKC